MFERLITVKELVFRDLNEKEFEEWIRRVVYG